MANNTPYQLQLEFKDGRFSRLPSDSEARAIYDNIINNRVGIDSGIVDDIKLPRGYASYKANPFYSPRVGGYGSITPGYVLEGSVAKDAEKAREIASNLDTLYNRVPNKLPSRSLGQIAKQYTPGVSDVWDIGAGINRLSHPANKLDPWLGLGQAGLGVIGLGSLLAAPFTGGSSIVAGQGGKQLTKALVKNIAKQAASRGQKIGLGALANNSRREIRSAVRSALKKSKLSELLHGKYRGGLSSLLFGYDIFKNPGEEQVGYEQQPINEESNNTNPIINEELIKESKPSDIPSIDLDFDDSVPKTNTEDFINNLVATNGLGSDGEEDVDSSTPRDLNSLVNALRANGWEDKDISPILNGLNNGRRDVADMIDSYNKTALPGEQITVPKTQEEVDAARNLSSADNQQLTDEDAKLQSEYLNKLLADYEANRKLYQPYYDKLNDLANNYGKYATRSWNMYRAGDLNKPDDLINLVKEGADLSRAAADFNVQDRQTKERALANYLVARELGLPVGSDYADEAMIKQLMGLRVAQQTAQNKLATELLKIQANSQDKALDRASRLQIEQLKIRAANDRARLARELQIKQLQLRKAIAEGNWRQQANLRNSINETNKKINAARFIAEGGIYGIENADAFNSAMNILGYSNRVSGNSSNNVADWEKELREQNRK